MGLIIYTTTYTLDCIMFRPFVSNLIKQPHPAKAGDSTTCTSAFIDPELAVVLEGKKSAPQVPREWKNNSPTQTHDLCLLIY